MNVGYTQNQPSVEHASTMGKNQTLSMHCARLHPHILLCPSQVESQTINGVLVKQYDVPLNRKWYVY